MIPPRLPDPARSRALLIGASHFAAGTDLPAIPAVRANLTDLRRVLTSPDTGVLRPERCRMLADPTSVDEVGAALSAAVSAATDLLLVYYAGHGLVDDRGRLHLALAHTQPHRARWTALPLELLREEIATSVAATRVLVLDCCFSGRAIETMADAQTVISGQLDVAGTYTLTSTTANAPSHAPVGDRHTAFTGALLHALDNADPLTLDQIYTAIDRDLAARNLPRPQRRAVNAAGDLALSLGPATAPRPTEPLIERSDSDPVRFAHSYTLPKVALFLFRFARRAICIVLGIDFFSLAMDREFGTLVTVGTLALIVWLVGSQYRKFYVGELVVDRSGLTVQRKPVGAHLPWRDIAQVGVLQPERGSLNLRLPAAPYTRKSLLVVRLLPEVPAPDVQSLLSDEHRQLGYLGLCTLDSVGSSPPEMISALERFAGAKLLHSPRQFLDRDPRLRPTMV
ncbi:MAG: caspase family protein [Pseudonocardiaceae bacterium]